MLEFTQDLALSLTKRGEEFPVNFEDAWCWIGYSTKQKAQKKLTSTFEEGTDYTLNQTVKSVKGHRGGGSINYLDIRLTIDCFKSLGMLAGTEQGAKIRKYFLECERIAQKAAVVIPEQANRIKELELELKLAQAQERAASANQKLLSTVQFLEAVSPGLAPLALGRADAVVTRIERYDHVQARNEAEEFDGVGISYIQKRFGFRTTQAAWKWLESIGYGKDSGLWKESLCVVNAVKLPSEVYEQLFSEFASKKGSRQLIIGE
ncbi:MAG: hypothetical protein WBB28_01305 [Crinalium sp.]